MSEHKRIECRISGRVQMVMYRDFVTRTARKLQLTGEVWNTPDGAVAVVAEGREEALQQLTKALWRGPLLSHVRDVLVQYKEPTGAYTQFTLRYT